MTLGNGYRVVNHFMLLINGQQSGEATNTNFIVFGLTRPGLEGEPASHYTTDAVPNIQVAGLNIKR